MLSVFVKTTPHVQRLDQLLQGHILLTPYRKSAREHESCWCYTKCLLCARPHAGLA